MKYKGDNSFPQSKKFIIDLMVESYFKNVIEDFELEILKKMLQKLSYDDLDNLDIFLASMKQGGRI